MTGVCIVHPRVCPSAGSARSAARSQVLVLLSALSLLLSSILPFRCCLLSKMLHVLCDAARWRSHNPQLSVTGNDIFALERHPAVSNTNNLTDLGLGGLQDLWRICDSSTVSITLNNHVCLVSTSVKESHTALLMLLYNCPHMHRLVCHSTR
jgi:hypothetical protein